MPSSDTEVRAILFSHIASETGMHFAGVRVKPSSSFAVGGKVAEVSSEKRTLNEWACGIVLLIISDE